MPIGGELGLGAPVSRATDGPAPKKGHLLTKHLYKDSGHEEFHATLDNVFVAAGHASTTDANGGRGSSKGSGEAQRTHQAGVHHEKTGHGTPKAVGGMFGLGSLAGHGVGHPAKEENVGILDGRRQSARASVLGHGSRTSARGSQLGLQGMHRGVGLSHALMGSAQEHAPEQDSMTALTSRSSIAGGFSLEGHHAQQETSNAASWGAAAADKTGESHKNNPLLEDEHLWVLLGDRNLDGMRKILKAGGALDKLWELLDTDRDGLVTYVETKSAFTLWSGGLAHKADDIFTAEERVTEPIINYSRFVEIFLPLALTVPEQDVLVHMSRQAAAAAPQKPAARATLQMAGGGQIGRKSLFGAAHDGKAIQRKKSIFHVPDFSVMGAEASAPRSSMMNDSPKKSIIGGRRTLVGDSNKLQAMLSASGAAGMAAGLVR